jgi:tRNA uridine 5-carbamoylmethylation protein Kti12
VLKHTTKVLKHTTKVLKHTTKVLKHTTKVLVPMKSAFYVAMSHCSDELKRLLVYFIYKIKLNRATIALFRTEKAFDIL